MKTKSTILLTCLLASVFPGIVNAQAEKETKYLAFQIFTYGPNPKIATMGEGTNPQLARFPDKAVLRDYIQDIKRRIGTVGDPQTRLAVMLGHLSFDHGDAEVTRFIELGFELALETDVAVGFHIDDSMFWAGRKDLWSDPKNVEAMDWDGTPSTGRILNWGKEPSAAPPQMCFNSKVIQREVQQRAALIGRAIQAGVNRLQQLKRPELFAGVIAGSETQIGQDFKTGKYLGYRALLNRGFSREHPPQDMNLEREKVVQEFIELWTTGLADAGVPPQKIYSHICFLSRRAFGLGDNKDVTYMQHSKETTYSEHNHFTPPSVAFGKNHRPGFSTYPQPGLYDDIYEQLAKHQQVGWASCEGTNMQPESGPGQTGIGMETYLAKMFNHGATLTTIFSWGIGGEAMKEKIGFRVVTEGEEALQAYRKFLKGDTLIEGKTEPSLTDRLPPKIHKIQDELPAWMEKTGNNEKAVEAAALMQKMQEQLKAKNFEDVEKTADSILKMIGGGAQAAAPDNPEAVHKRVAAKVERVIAVAQKWAESGRDPSAIGKIMEDKVKPLLDAGKFIEAEVELDRVLEQLEQDGNSTATTAAPAGDVHQRVAVAVADNSKKAADSFEAAFFPPELILLAQDRIALTPEQLAAFRARLEKTQQRSDELRVKLEHESAAASALMKQERVDESALIAQLGKVLDVASELKHLHVDAVAAVKNLLTPERLAKLRELGLEIARNHATFTKLEEEAGRRISAKVERVKVGVQEWADSGRDPAVITQAMEEKFKPLMEADKPMSAEAELDRVLEQLK